MTVNTIASAENAVGATLLLPNASVLGPGFRIIGATVYQKPTNTTLSDGVTFRDWSAVIYLTNQPFVNRTTLYSTVDSAATFVLTEGPPVPGLNNYTLAESELQPSQFCTESNINTSSVTTSCSNIPHEPPVQLTKIGDTYVAVSPSAPSATFMVGANGLRVYIAPPGTGLAYISYQQVLAIATNMISPPSDSAGA
jgi:hypothetical protein